MKKTLPQIVFLILFILTACGQSTTAPQATPTPVVEETSTPTFLPTSTQTSVPSLTPTASVTPLPTIPTFTPTEASENVSCLPKPIQITRSDGSHIGLRTPPELNGIKNLDALLIQSGDEFSIGLNLILKGENQYLFWLERFCDNQDGQRFTEVVDEIILPPLREGEFAVTTCHLINEPNSHVVATGYYREEIISGATHIKVIATQAWLINFDDWIFKEVPNGQLGNVSCIHEHN